MRASVTFFLLLLAPAAASGQQTTDVPEIEILADPGDLARIQPATYGAEGRRDPFAPLTSGADPGDGPRFEQLTLTGIFLGSSGTSIAVLEDPLKRGHFVRVGETIGNARLLALHSHSADFEIRDYGIVRRETLQLLRDGDEVRQDRR